MKIIAENPIRCWACGKEIPTDYVLEKARELYGGEIGETNLEG